MTYEEPDIYSSTAQFLLWSVRLKATASRIALIELLKNEKHPISVEELGKKFPEGLKVSTIYRSLETLVAAGLIRKIHTGIAHACYELVHGRKHHHHIICTKCGEMEDVTNCTIRYNESEIVGRTKNFKTVSDHSLEFFGLCLNCEPQRA